MYVRLLKLLILAGAVSFLFFFLSIWLSEQFIYDYCTTTDYEEQRNLEYLSRLQGYIDENRITAENTQMLEKWVKKQKIISLRIYRNNTLLFDSEYLNMDEAEYESGYPSWKTYYILDFADGEADVALFGMYFYQLYNRAFIGELVLAFLLFITIVLFGIRKTIRYIQKLSEEIGILEGGNLDYEITVTGRDELAALAKGLDEMRRSFRSKVGQEARLIRANQKMITEMSHDLRTPLTSILLYAEILKKYTMPDEMAQSPKGEHNISAECKPVNQVQIQNYIEKIIEKTIRLKQMSDHLFEYTLISGESETTLEKPAVIEIVFYDLLSETCAYLEQNGFSVSLELFWKEAEIRVSTDYVLRIMDNITSNLLKYAGHMEPVRIRTLYTDNSAGISIENDIRLCPDKEDSTGIGLGNVKNMMAKMNGHCHITESQRHFKISLLFPIVPADLRGQESCP